MSNPDYTPDTPKFKACTDCGEIFPATREYFYPLKDGIRSICKSCSKRRTREYWATHSDARREYDKRYREEHSEKIQEQRRAYRRENIDKIKEKDKHYREEHREKAIQYSREYYKTHREQLNAQTKAYYRNHKEKLAEAGRVYYESHREQARESSRKWARKNSDKHRVNERNRRARLRNAEGTHTAADIQEHVKGQTDSKGRLRCWWCGKVIKDTYHVDHVIPLVKGGSNGTSNLCISCPVCNLSKNDKLPGEWSGRLM